jgi:hypothetical protein
MHQALVAQHRDRTAGGVTGNAEGAHEPRLGWQWIHVGLELARLDAGAQGATSGSASLSGQPGQSHDKARTNLQVLVLTLILT